MAREPLADNSVPFFPIVSFNTPLCPMSDAILAHNLASASAASGLTALNAVCIPFIMPYDGYASSWFVYNGATVSGQFNVAMYNGDTGALIGSSGAQTQAGTNVVQEGSIGFTVPVGVHYMAFACDNTTATFFRIAPSTYFIRAFGAVRLVLPDIGTWPTNIITSWSAPTTGYLPHFGFTISPHGSVI